MLLGGVSEQSPPLLGDVLLLLGDVETVADRLSPLAVLVLPPPLAEAVICTQLAPSDLCSHPPPRMSLIMQAMSAPLSALHPRTSSTRAASLMNWICHRRRLARSLGD